MTNLSIQPTTELWSDLLDLLSSHLGIPKKNLMTHTDFMRDLELDSLEFIDTMMVVEEKFEIDIHADMLEDNTPSTVGELYELITRELQSV